MPADDPRATPAPNPIYDGRAPCEEAAIWGHPDIVELLRNGGTTSGRDEIHQFLLACMTPDRARAERLLRADPTITERAMARYPDQLVRAAERGSLEAAVVLVELGFDVNAMNRTAPLHEAAMRGNLDMIELLIAHGSDPNQRDRSYDATPAGWAEHHKQREAQAHLSRLET